MKCLSCGTALPLHRRASRKFCNGTCRKDYHRKTIRQREACQQRGQRERRNEWYSPQNVVDAARRVMGEIDLDPASCFRANEIVRATKYYDQSADGLTQPLHGRVWLNPPYDTFAPKFFVKFCEEYEAGHVPMAVLRLGAHHLTTVWFQRAGAFPAMLSLPSRRLKFTSSLDRGNPPMHGSAILGVGVNPELFRSEFAELGIILELHAERGRHRPPRALSDALASFGAGNGLLPELAAHTRASLLLQRPSGDLLSLRPETVGN